MIINTFGLGLLVFLFLKKKQADNTDQIASVVESQFDKSNKIFKEEMSLSRKEMADSEKRLREELSGLFKGFGDTLDKRMSELATAQNKNFDGFSLKLTELIDKNDGKMDKVREVVEKKVRVIAKR